MEIFYTVVGVGMFSLIIWLSDKNRILESKIWLLKQDLANEQRKSDRWKSHYEDCKQSRSQLVNSMTFYNSNIPRMSIDSSNNLKTTSAYVSPTQNRRIDDDIPSAMQAAYTYVSSSNITSDLTDEIARTVINSTSDYSSSCDSSYSSDSSSSSSCGD